MSFLDTVRQARAYLEEHGRVSLGALKLEYELDDAYLEALVEELVDIQQVAAREGKALSWIGAASTEPSGSAVQSTAEPTAPHAPEAERRQLTVLFCDLVDSTRLAAGMDPEDWRELVRGYQEAAARIVEQFDGHIAQYLGDGLLVYFGWPRAHEDDAERAVRAGLGIVDETAASDERLSARIGIHTGPVVVGEMGGGESRETLAMGDTTNVAARLQGFASPDTVVVSSRTLRLVAGIFVTRDLGEQTLKGLADSVRAFEAVQPSGVRSRLDVAAATGLTPLVGRDQELGLLEDRFAQVAEERGQAVLVAGEAGIGKSRLMAAFRERLSERAHTWLECRGSAYTQDSALFPVLELQRQGLGFRPEDAPEAKLAQLEAGLQGTGFDLDETMPFLAALHGVPFGESYQAPNLSPQGLRKKTLRLLTEWLLRLGQRQPLVLLMEDLHWMDPSTVELLGAILEQLPTTSVLLVATFRPDFEPPWGARSHLTPMLLARLTRTQLGDLVRKAARGRDLPDAWVEEIVRRSDGVPLFAEELTRTVLESHPEPPAESAVPELHIPESLQDSLMARLDALGPVKELAQLGAVLGREFSYDLLLKVSPLKESELQPSLEVALREELFYQRGTPPEATYLFKHALIRDAAYQSLLRSTRQRHHLRVADTLIDRLPAIADSQPELVAHHLVEASDADRAIAWWRKAGQRDILRSAHAEAAHHLLRALDALESFPRSPERDAQELTLRTLLGVSLVASDGYAASSVERNFARARDLCDQSGESPHLFPIIFGLWLFHQARADQEPTRELGAQLLRLATRGGEQDLLLEARFAAGVNGFWQGDFERAQEHFAEVQALYELERHRRHAMFYGQDPFVFTSILESWRLWHQGYPERALASWDRGMVLAEELRHPFTLAGTLAFGTMLRVWRREPERVAVLGSQLQSLSTDHGFPLWAGVASFFVGWALAEQGSLSEGLDIMRNGFSSYVDTGARMAGCAMAAFLADVLRRSSNTQEALPLVNEWLELSETSLDRFHVAELRRLRGELTADGDSLHEAAACLRQAIAVAQSLEAKGLELRAATSLARLCQRQGKRIEARDVLQPVYDWFTEGFDTQDLKDAKALLEELG